MFDLEETLEFKAPKFKLAEGNRPLGFVTNDETVTGWYYMENGKFVRFQTNRKISES